jgi:hypothetical protein
LYKSKAIAIAAEAAPPDSGDAARAENAYDRSCRVAPDILRATAGAYIASPRPQPVQEAFTLKCPHCLVEIFEHAQLGAIIKDKDAIWRTDSQVCPACGSAIIGLGKL